MRESKDVEVFQYRRMQDPSTCAHACKHASLHLDRQLDSSMEASAPARVRANTQNAYLRAPVDSDFVIVLRRMVADEPD